MDALDVLGGIVVVALFGAGLLLFTVLGIMLVVLSFYASAYTVALFHILFIEPVIFDTYSLFTIPYNQIYAIALLHELYYWALAVVYMFGITERGYSTFSSN